MPAAIVNRRQPTIETGRKWPIPPAKLQNPVLMAVDRRRARHQGRAARQDLHRRCAGARRVRPAVRQGWPQVRNRRHQAAGNGGRRALQGRRRPQRRRGADRHRAFRRPRGAADGTGRGGILSHRPRRPGGGRERGRRDRHGRRGAEFRRRRHSGDRRAGAEGRAGAFHQGRRSAGRSLDKDDPRRPHRGRPRRRPADDDAAAAIRRPGSGFDPKRRPRGPRDAGGNR